MVCGIATHSLSPSRAHLTMSQVLINTHRISVSLGHSLCVGGIHHSARQEGRKGQLTAGSVPRWSLILVSCRYLYFQSWVGEGLSRDDYYDSDDAVAKPSII